jgi:hypothetical protein
MTSQSTSHTNGFSKPEAMEEEKFEDVGLDDEEAKPKKKGIFARFSDFSGESQTSGNTKPATQHLGFHIPSRKKGSTTLESELGTIRPPVGAGAETA